MTAIRRPAGRPAVEPVHVRFGRHHATVRSRAPEVAERLRGLVEPMLADRPDGACAGLLDVAVQDGGWVVSQPGAPAAPDAARFADASHAARALLHAVVRAFMRARPDLIWLHAAAMARDGRACVFPAASGQGKSTLVGELLARGWGYLSDEIAPIDPARCAVLPFPVAPHRRVASGRPLADADVQQLPKVRVHLEPGAVHGRALPVAGVRFLAYCPTADATRLVECPPGAAVVQMMRHSFGDEATRPGELVRLCAMMSRVDALQVRYASARDAAGRLEASAARPSAQPAGEPPAMPGEQPHRPHQPVQAA